MPVWMSFDDQGNCTVMVHGSDMIKPAYPGLVEVANLDQIAVNPDDFILDGDGVRKKTDSEKANGGERHARKRVSDHFKSLASNNKSNK